MYDRTMFSISVTMLSDWPSAVHAQNVMKKLQRVPISTQALTYSTASLLNYSYGSKTKMLNSHFYTFNPNKTSTTKIKISDVNPNAKCWNQITYLRQSLSDPGDRSVSGSQLQYHFLVSKSSKRDKVISFYEHRRPCTQSPHFARIRICTMDWREFQ